MANICLRSIFRNSVNSQVISSRGLASSASLSSKSLHIEVKEGLAILPYIQGIGKLLYEVYIEEPGEVNAWKFGTENPSNISVESDEVGQKILGDKYMRDEGLIKRTSWVVSNFKLPLQCIYQ